MASVLGTPSSAPTSSVPALYTTPTTSAQEFPLSGSSSGTSRPERVLEVVHQASTESSTPSARSQTPLLYSIFGTLGALTARQTSYRRGRFTVFDEIRTPSATSQASLLNSSSSSFFGSTHSVWWYCSNCYMPSLTFKFFIKFLVWFHSLSVGWYCSITWYNFWSINLCFAFIFSRSCNMNRDSLYVTIKTAKNKLITRKSWWQLLCHQSNIWTFLMEY
ncbi:hypothetical protein QN277_003220 [Acacia crassicarpa]|uniref:Uncharacterized protein n=1 Tax=Acacia crassicarpa TaxID=499986 RepID=A0AAE1MF80_9FABA|nr:hypothetical protein QN277_003220 [Acacia crassicarpa]